MDSGRFIFDSSLYHGGRMLVLGGTASPIFRGARSVQSDKEGANKRRPFFTTAEELLEEDYYDEQLPDKKRRLTLEQVHLLERSFEAENKLEPERKCELAKKLGLQPRQVAVWFQNRRARWKTKQLELECDRLKANFDALLADHDVLLKDNDRLRSQVISLTEKLRDKELTVAGKQAVSDSQEEEAIEGQLLQPLPSLPVPLPRWEDRLSTGSGGSVVVDGVASVLPIDSSVDSVIPGKPDTGRCQMLHGSLGGVLSEEDGGSSDDGCSYLPGGMFTEAADADNWWFWS